MHRSQFFLLRIVWQKNKVGELADTLKELCGVEKVATASRLLKDNQDWQKYLKTLPQRSEKRSRTPAFVGQFTQVRWKQLVLQNEPEADEDDDEYALNSLTPSKKMLDQLAPRRSPHRPGTYAESAPTRTPSQETEHSSYSASSEALLSQKVMQIAKDELLVTTYRESLLTAINMTIFGSNMHLHHSIARKVYHLGDMFSAAVDGTDATLTNPSFVKAIYEDKRNTRGQLNRAIRQQESGEMVCWIYEDSEEHHGVTRVVTHTERQAADSSPAQPRVRRTYKRLLIAQDCHELYIMIATYDDRYIAYIRHEAPLRKLEQDGDRVFLTMSEYGPFSIRSIPDMMVFGRHYVTLLLHWRQEQHGGSTSESRALEFGRSPSTSRGSSQQRAESLARRMAATRLEAQHTFRTPSRERADPQHRHDISTSSSEGNKIMPSPLAKYPRPRPPLDPPTDEEHRGRRK